jgi:prepilin-type processing-associated H-X9-DG protein
MNTTNLNQAERSTRGTHAKAAFTRADAVVCVAVVAMMGLLMLPALANGAARGHAAVCRANLGRLIAGWTQFANDNQDALPRVLDGIGNGPAWASGWLDYTGASDNTNTLNVSDARYSQVGPYVGDVRVFKCPSDLSRTRRTQADGSSVWLPRVRSYSGNVAIAGSGNWIMSPYRIYNRLHDIVSPPPSGLWVFIDEHPDSINDAAFAVQMPAGPSDTRMVDYPASHHERSGALAFADGHVELHLWTDSRTLPPVRYSNVMPLNVAQPNSADVMWLTARTSGIR